MSSARNNHGGGMHTSKRLRSSDVIASTSPTEQGPKPVKKLGPQVVTTLHTENLATHVWLVKVPKFVDDAWQSDRSATVKAKLILNQDTPTPSVILELPPAAQPTKPPAVAMGRRSNVIAQSLAFLPPKRYELKMMPLDDQDMVFFKQYSAPGEGEILVPGTAGQAPVELPKLNMELLGIVDKRFDASIIMDSNYFQTRKAMEVGQKKKPATVLLSQAVDMFKPGSKHAQSMFVNTKGIAAGGIGVGAPGRSAKRGREERNLGKNVRGEREEVKNTLFMAFGDHDYYQLADLQKLTKQPISFLKEILEEMCVKETGQLHRGAYRLKSEYRVSNAPPAADASP